MQQQAIIALYPVPTNKAQGNNNNRKKDSIHKFERVLTGLVCQRWRASCSLLFQVCYNPGSKFRTICVIILFPVLCRRFALNCRQASQMRTTQSQLSGQFDSNLLS